MLPHQPFLRNESILIQTLTTHQTPQTGDLWAVNYESGIFLFRRNDLFCAKISNTSKLEVVNEVLQNK